MAAPPDLQDENLHEIWVKKEVIDSGALNVGTVPISTLKNEISPLLRRERWTNISDDDFNILLPSIRLASNWLDVLLPYICTFLPADHLHEAFTRHIKEQKREEIHLRRNITTKDILLAKAEIEDLAKSITWTVNHDMYSDHGWLGITRVTPGDPPWDVIDPSETKRWDEKWKWEGKKRRPLILAVCGEYLDALREFGKGEEGVRAGFMAAYTIVHEVGHAIWYQDFRGYNYESAEEPHINEDSWVELGLSFGAWLFNGFTPSTSNQGRHLHKLDFNAHLHWEVCNSSNYTPAPWKTLYSISMDYINKSFSQTWWDKLGDRTPSWYSHARKALKPNYKVKGESKVAIGWSQQFESGRGGSLRNGLKGSTEEESLASWHTRGPAYRDRTRYEGSVYQHLTAEGQAWLRGEGKRLPPAEMQVRSHTIRIPEGVEGWYDITVTDTVEQDGTEHDFWTDILPISAKGSHSGQLEDYKDVNEEETDEELKFTPSWRSQYLDVNEILTSFSVSSLENLNHQQALVYCQAQNIRFGRTNITSIPWCASHLNSKNANDRSLIERIRQHKFYELLDHLFVENSSEAADMYVLEEIAKPILEAIIRSVQWWGKWALDAHIKKHGIKLRRGWKQDIKEKRLLVQIWWQEWFEENVNGGVKLSKGDDFNFRSRSGRDVEVECESDEWSDEEDIKTGSMLLRKSYLARPWLNPPVTKDLKRKLNKITRSDKPKGFKPLQQLGLHFYTPHHTTSCNWKPTTHQKPPQKQIYDQTLPLPSQSQTKPKPIYIPRHKTESAPILPQPHSPQLPTITNRLLKTQSRVDALELTTTKYGDSGIELLLPHLKGVKSESVLEMLDRLRDLEEDWEAEREEEGWRALKRVRRGNYEGGGGKKQKRKGVEEWMEGHGDEWAEEWKVFEKGARRRERGDEGVDEEDKEGEKGTNRRLRLPPQGVSHMADLYRRI